MTRAFRALSAGLALVAGVVVTPSALLAWGTPPSVLAQLWVVDGGRVLLGLLTAVGWLAWAVFAASVLAEVVNAIARRRLIRLPGLTGVQHVAGLLVMAALAGLGPIATSLPAQPNPQHQTVGLTSESTASPLVTPASAEPELMPADALPAEGGEASEADSRSAEYVIQPGDDLWSIAEAHFGDGRAWREIVAANPTELIDPTAPLVPGARLTVPRSESTGRTTVTVVRGDTLSGLAATHLGKAAKWPAIFAANRDKISDPDEIDVGWRLRLPTASRSKTSSPGERTTATDNQSDTTRGEPLRPDSSTDRPSPTRPAGSATESTASPSVEGEPTVSSSPSGTNQGQSQAVADPTSPSALAIGLTGGLGSLAAALVLSAVAVRRQAQLRARPLGRRVPPPAGEVQRYRTALGQRQRPDYATVLERTLRFLGHCWYLEGQPIPALRRVVIGDDGVQFVWHDRPAEPVAPFRLGDGCWEITLDDAAALPLRSHPVPYPALVTLGFDPEQRVVLVDLETRDVLSISGPATVRSAVVAALAVELACTPWAGEARLTVVGGDLEFLERLMPDGCELTDDVQSTIEQLAVEVASRETAFGSSAEFRLTRLDPDRGPAAPTHVVVFADPLTSADAERLCDAVEGADRGVVAVLAGTSRVRDVWQLMDTTPEPAGLLHPDGLTVVPQRIEEHTRVAIGHLARAATASTTVPAPWWPADSESNVRLLERSTEDTTDRHRGDPSVGDHAATDRPDRALEAGGATSSAVDPESPPVTLGETSRARRALLDPRPADSAMLAGPTLHIMGPISLQGARGLEPARARRQCEEYCGWLLENPGRTPTQMAAELLVAEGTRRSNMSRLRSWLGNDDEGHPFLPDAYSGRIHLSPGVDSDWLQFSTLVAAGVNRTHPETLMTALELVRGAPLADAAPGQWHWAEEMRTEIVSVVRDAGVVLAKAARDGGNLDLSRWAANRALVAAPEDELLLGERVRTELSAGNRREVERLCQRLTHSARVLGVDLMPETVALCQRALEGRLRARA